MLRLLVLVGAALLLSSAAAPAPAPAFYADASDDGALPVAGVSTGEEPMILVAGGTLLVGDTAGVHRSTDGGATWTRSAHPFLPGAFTDGRALAVDDAGRLYAAHTQGQFIGVAVSANMGATWEWTSHVVAANSIADRPWLSAQGDGKVVLVWYGDFGEQCAYSSDAGRTWTTRTLTGGGVPNAGSVHLDEAGRVWYTNGASIFRWSTPCGAIMRTVPLGASGPQILDQLAVDDAGRAYAALPSFDSSRMEVRGVRNMDASTLKTLSVSPAVLRSNTFGAIATKADGSELAVAWYGSESAGNPSASFSGEWNVYVARVTGYWTASPVVTVQKVTTEPNHVGGYCMSGIACTTGTADRDLLDYFGVAYAPDGTLHVAYGHDGATTNAVVRHAALAP